MDLISVITITIVWRGEAAYTHTDSEGSEDLTQKII